MLELPESHVFSAQLNGLLAGKTEAYMGGNVYYCPGCQH